MEIVRRPSLHKLQVNQKNFYQESACKWGHCHDAPARLLPLHCTYVADPVVFASIASRSVYFLRADVFPKVPGSEISSLPAMPVERYHPRGNNALKGAIDRYMYCQPC